MTVADLIRELQTMPQNIRVMVLNRTVYTGGYEGTFMGGDFQVPDEQAGEADEVRAMGPYVLIRGQ